MASCVVIESDSDTNKDFRHQVLFISICRESYSTCLHSSPPQISKAEAKLEAMRNREREKKQQVLHVLSPVTDRSGQFLHRTPRQSKCQR